jgi:hypothetical protein
LWVYLVARLPYLRLLDNRCGETQLAGALSNPLHLNIT